MKKKLNPKTIYIVSILQSAGVACVALGFLCVMLSVYSGFSSGFGVLFCVDALLWLYGVDNLYMSRKIYRLQTGKEAVTSGC